MKQPMTMRACGKLLRKMFPDHYTAVREELTTYSNGDIKRECDIYVACRDEGYGWFAEFDSFEDAIAEVIKAKAKKEN